MLYEMEVRKCHALEVSLCSLEAAKDGLFPERVYECLRQQTSGRHHFLVGPMDKVQGVCRWTHCRPGGLRVTLDYKLSWLTYSLGTNFLSYTEGRRYIKYLPMCWGQRRADLCQGYIVCSCLETKNQNQLLPPRKITCLSLIKWLQ